jgi:lipid-A-disaccharide synthase
VTKNNNQKILIISGEHSGDNLGAKLIDALKAKQPQLEFAIMGGKKMQATGAELILDSSSLDIVGIWEALMQWRALKIAFKKIRDYLEQQRPKLVILIDYPGFNLRIAQDAKKYGCKVLFYVSPQIWAWRYGRIKKIKQRVDHMAVLFPFEKEIYEKEGVPVTFVGHPMLEWVKCEKSKTEIAKQMQLDLTKPIICLLPGSRMTEINRHMPILNECITKIKKALPGAQFILPVAASINLEEVKSKIQHKITLSQANTYECLAVSSAAICASGTASLEVALFAVPMIIFYKLSWITYCLIRLFVFTKWVGLCNIIAQKEIVKEFIQHKAQSGTMSREVIKLIENKDYHQKISNELAQLKQQIRCEDKFANPSDNVAALAMALLR